MPLEYDDVPRFTPEQRAAILNLAMRFQAEHEATVSAHDLARAAAEAGIDPRFVHKATRRLGRKSRMTSTFRGPIAAFVLVAIQAVFFMYVGHSGGLRGDFSKMLSPIAIGVAMTLLLSLWASSNRAIRRFVPLVPLATWTVVGSMTSVVESQLVGEYYGWVLPSAVVFGVVETLTALFAVLARTIVEREPRPTRSLRGY